MIENSSALPIYLKHETMQRLNNRAWDIIVFFLLSLSHTHTHTSLQAILQLSTEFLIDHFEINTKPTVNLRC